MSHRLTKEEFTEILAASARCRFGEERTKLLQPRLEEAGRALASIAEQSLDLEEEPAFFL